MSEDNPPLALPNGQIYSGEALRAIAQNNNGIIKCPVTGESFRIEEARKCYII